MHIVIKAITALALAASLLAHVHATAWSQETFTFYPTEDAWVNEANPTANYGNSTYLSVKDSSGLSEAFFKFSPTDISKLSGKAITGASLYLYQYMGTYTPGDAPGIYKVLDSWQEPGVTWNNKPRYSQETYSSLSLDSGTNTWRGWGGLQGLVASWESNPANNFGLALSNSADGKKDTLFSRFYSSEIPDITKRPYLQVTTTATPEPVSSALFLLGAGSVALKRCRRRLIKE